VAANLVGVCAAPTKLSKHPTDREDSLCTNATTAAHTIIMPILYKPLIIRLVEDLNVGMKITLLTFKTFDLRLVFNVGNTLVLIIYQSLLMAQFY